jgi:hypothetical protein
VVSPYGHSASLASSDFRLFNKAVSNIRIRSEHAIGYLKGRFQALKGIRHPVKDSDTHTTTCKAIISMMVAHSIALGYDAVDDCEFFTSMDSSSAEAILLTQSIQHQQEEENRIYREEEAFQQRFVSQYRRDKDRRHKARLHREALHKALFRGKGLEFKQTTETSRLQERTRDRMRQR